MIRARRRIREFLLAIYFLGITAACTAEPLVLDTATSIPESILSKLKGNLQAKYSFNDKSGSHFIALTRQSNKLPDGTDKITLQALQFGSFKSEWKQEWIINDILTCKDLDIAADFNAPLTSISDLDSNGIAETTVAHQLACLGGIDSKPTKAIMRQGSEKYAVRGESLVQIEGAPSFGGKFTEDASLAKKPVFKSHLVSVWKRAAGINP